MLKKPISALKNFFNPKPPKVAPPVTPKVHVQTLSERGAELAEAERQKKVWWKDQVLSKYQVTKINRWRAKKKMKASSQRRQRV